MYVNDLKMANIKSWDMFFKLCNTYSKKLF